MQEKSLLQLKTDEGLRLKPYHCTSGKLTIGYGRNIQDVGISEKEADFMFQNDITECEERLKQYDWWNNLDEVRKDIITNMVFNMGFQRVLMFVKMIDALKQKNYKNASMQMLDSKWATQVKGRAMRLAKQMETGLSQ